MTLNSELCDLSEKARHIRLSILEAIYGAGKGHIGGAYSIVEILVSLFYAGNIKFDAANPNWSGRDRLVLSKGHAAVALYAVLADIGFFDIEELAYLNKGRLLGEHPDPRIPGIETLGGSLGHGLSFVVGSALADKIDQVDRRHFVVMGDGECYEGSVWEAAMFAGHHKLSNVCAIIDRNGLITHGSTETFNKLEPFAEKWEAFGWEVCQVNGHNFEQLNDALRSDRSEGGSPPLAIIASTIKGKGVTFMEGRAEWHHGGLSEDQYAAAKESLKV